MKTRLSELTLADFIEMECGNLEVLKGRHEVVPRERLVKARYDISNEFQSIASPSSFKSMVIGRGKKTKLRVKVMFFSALKALVEMSALDDVRRLLTAYGIDCSGFDDARLTAEVNQQLNAATFDLKRMGIDGKDESVTTPDEVRKCYEGMVADLMIANKMSIDIDTIRASVFASMIHKANEIAKALAAKTKKVNKK